MKIRTTLLVLFASATVLSAQIAPSLFEDYGTVNQIGFAYGTTKFVDGIAIYGPSVPPNGAPSSYGMEYIHPSVIELLKFEGHSKNLIGSLNAPIVPFLMRAFKRGHKEWYGEKMHGVMDNTDNSERAWDYPLYDIKLSFAFWNGYKFPLYIGANYGYTDLALPGRMSLSADNNVYSTPWNHDNFNHFNYGLNAKGWLGGDVVAFRYQITYDWLRSKARGLHGRGIGAELTAFIGEDKGGYLTFGYKHETYYDIPFASSPSSAVTGIHDVVINGWILRLGLYVAHGR